MDGWGWKEGGGLLPLNGRTKRRTKPPTHPPIFSARFPPFSSTAPPPILRFLLPSTHCCCCCCLPAAGPINIGGPMMENKMEEEGEEEKREEGEKKRRMVVWGAPAHHHTPPSLIASEMGERAVNVNGWIDEKDGEREGLFDVQRRRAERNMDGLKGMVDCLLAICYCCSPLHSSWSGRTDSTDSHRIFGCLPSPLLLSVAVAARSLALMGRREGVGDAKRRRWLGGRCGEKAGKMRWKREWKRESKAEKYCSHPLRISEREVENVRELRGIPGSNLCCNVKARKVNLREKNFCNREIKPQRERESVKRNMEGRLRRFRKRMKE